MELIKDIYFNTDKLVENTKVKISYTGKFYQSENDKVYIHYGYGENWNNVTDVEMKKTDLGYQTELNLIGSDTLNFCFKNQSNEWDNNLGKNYIFNIEKPATNAMGKTIVGVKDENVNSSFYGKTYGESYERTYGGTVKNNGINETISNVYWSSKETPNKEINKAINSGSGIIEDTVIGTPESIDTIIGAADLSDLFEIEPTPKVPNTTNTFGTIGNTTTIKPTSNTVTQDTIPVSTLFNTGINNVGNPTTPNVANGTPVNTGNNIFSNIKFGNNLFGNKISGNGVNTTSTALTIANNGKRWAQKIKTTVCKFFSYVPKFISGNYKRTLSGNKNPEIK